MNYNLQGKTWEGASDLLEVNWRLGNPHSQEGHPERAGLHVCRPFPVGFFKNADSHVAPPSDLGTAVGAGDNALIGRMGREVSLLLPHLRHLSGEACVSALIGSGMTLRPFWSVELPQERNAGQVYSQSGLCQGESLRRGHTAAKKPTTVSYTGYAAANRPMKPPSVDHALWQRAD